MTDVLETLREVDRHFQKESGVDVPEQVREFKNLGGVCFYEDRRFQYDLWRRVRAAIKELENGRSGSAGHTRGTADVTTAQPSGAANYSEGR